MMDFDNRTVVVTGAAGNLGAAVAHAFASRGARLALLDLDRDILGKAFGAEDDNRLLLPVDLLDRDRVNAAVGTIIDRFGRIDVLCNIAGGFRMGEPVHETSRPDLGFPDGHQRPVADPCGGRRGAAHAEGRARQDRQCRSQCRAAAASPDGRLLRRQGRGDPADRSHVGRTARAGHQRQLRAADHHRHAGKPRAMPKADPKRWVAPAIWRR